MGAQNGINGSGGRRIEGRVSPAFPPWPNNNHWILIPHSPWACAPRTCVGGHRMPVFAAQPHLDCMSISSPSLISLISIAPPHLSTLPLDSFPSTRLGSAVHRPPPCPCPCVAKTLSLTLLALHPFSTNLRTPHSGPTRNRQTLPAIELAFALAIIFTSPTHDIIQPQP